MRSYVLAGNAGHYDGMIAALEARGLRVIPAFATGLDARPAIEKFFMQDGRPTIDAMVSLMGFSLVGGPAYNDAKAADEILTKLDVPYIAAHPVEFQTLEQWQEFGSRPAAGGIDDHGRDSRTRRLDGPRGFRRPGAGRHDLRRMRTPVRVSAVGEPARHACLRRARGKAGRARRETCAVAALGARQAQNRDRAVQLPAERRKYRHRGLSLGVRISAPSARRIEAGGLLRRRPPASVDDLRRRDHRRQFRSLRRAGERARENSDRRPRATGDVAQPDRSRNGARRRAPAVRRRVDPLCSASASAMSSSAFSPPSATKAIRCVCCSRKASRRRTRFPPSIAGCGKISARTPFCISAPTARWNSCRASRPASPRRAGRIV